MTAIVTGKNVRYVAMITTLVRPRPKPTTISGASATIGTVWLATTYGTKARSSSPEWTKTLASDDADHGADDEPDHRLGPRVQGLVEQVVGQAVVGVALERLAERARRCPTGAASCRSVSCRTRNGGVVEVADDVDPPGIAADPLGALPQERESRREARQRSG